MKMYLVEFDGERDYVLAESLGDALRIWRADYVNDCILLQCYEYGDEDQEPDQITILPARALLWSDGRAGLG